VTGSSLIADAPPSGSRQALTACRTAQVAFSLTLFLSFFRDYPLVPKTLLLLTALTVASLAVSDWVTLRHQRIPLGVLMLLAWAATSITWSADHHGSVSAVTTLAASVITGVGTCLILDLEQVAHIVMIVVKVLLVATLLSIVLFPTWATAPPELDPVIGWHGPFTHKNGLGSFLVIAVVTMLVIPTRRRILWASVIAVLLVGSQSSTALAISLIAVGAVVVRSVLLSQSRATRRALVTFIAAVGAIGVLALSRRPDLLLTALGRGSTLSGRTEIWTAVERRIAERPWAGWGWGGVWRSDSEPTLSMWREARFHAFHAHNGYLDVLLQVGCVGLVLFLGVLLRTAQQLGARASDPTSMWALLVLFSLSMTAISESAPFTATPGLLFLFAFATATLQRRSASPGCAGRGGAEPAATAPLVQPSPLTGTLPLAPHDARTHD
jgi:exopolysaccharide production protein ExoQ